MLALVLSLLLGLTALAPAAAQWDTSSSVDEMTGESSAYAHSPPIPATQPMAFPYQDTRAWVGFGCNGEREWAFIGFTEPPNLTDSSIGDGYSSIDPRIRWDDEPVGSTRLTQRWGDRFLDFAYDGPVIEKMQSAGTLLVELKWYGSGTTYFRFPLAGSTAAIQQARSQCAR